MPASPSPQSHVEITQTQDTLTFSGWNGTEAAFQQTFSARAGDFSCESGFIEFVGERECEVISGIMACATNEVHLSKNSEGALIMKYNSRGFGLVYLIPSSASEWHWSRFMPYRPAKTP